MAKDKRSSVVTRGKADAGEEKPISSTPQQGLLGDGATLDLLRPLIDQLVKAGLDALINWLKGNAQTVQRLPGRTAPGDPECNCMVPACPDAAGAHYLVCNNGTMSWQPVPNQAPMGPIGEESEDDN